MSGFFIALISLGYVIIAGVFYGIEYGITKREIKGCVCAMLWPILIIAVPIGLLYKYIVEKFKLDGKIK